MVAFEQASYVAQVHRLRGLAEQVLSRWPIRVVQCRFLNHGENTTFRIVADSGRKFMLRIHRRGYHTRTGILEELRWLEHLSAETSLTVPKPVRSKHGSLLEVATAAGVGAERPCCLFEWIEGHFVRKSLTRSHMAQIGGLIGMLQNASRGIPTAERHYWNAQGLIGRNPKLGAVHDLRGVSEKNQELINRAQHAVYRKLRLFEAAYPQRLGLIHADLHFDNILFSTRGIAAIDFDDCGFGFHAYDLAVSLLSAVSSLGRERRREVPAMREALIEAYAGKVGWDRKDEAILPYLMAARRLAMLGWLQSRSDNPILRKYMSKAVAKTVAYLRREMGL